MNTPWTTKWISGWFSVDPKVVRILIVAALGHAAIYIAIRMSRLMNIFPFCLPGCRLYGFTGLVVGLAIGNLCSGALVRLTTCPPHGKA